MRVVIFTWEFPPRIVGDLANYVNKLSLSLAENNVDVYVITFNENIIGLEDRSDGVKVYRVKNPITSHLNILTWDLTLTDEFLRAFSDIYYSTDGHIDLIDAHEWLSVDATTVIKNAFNIPILYTIHSIEDQRSLFANELLNISIKYLERLGCNDANRIFVTSNWMKKEICRLYEISNEKIDVASQTSPKWIDKVIATYKKTIESKGRL